MLSPRDAVVLLMLSLRCCARRAFQCACVFVLRPSSCIWDVRVVRCGVCVCACVCVSFDEWPPRAPLLRAAGSAGESFCRLERTEALLDCCEMMPEPRDPTCGALPEDSLSAPSPPSSCPRYRRPHACFAAQARTTLRRPVRSPAPSAGIHWCVREPGGCTASVATPTAAF